MTPSRRTVLLALAAVACAPAALAAGQSSAPASADECKGGGWRGFTSPVFKSQGECVSYVNALGTPGASDGAPPAAGNGNAGGNGNGNAGGNGNGNAGGNGNANPHAGGTGEANAPAPAPTAGAEPAATPAPEPTPLMGRSSVTQVEAGTVTVKLPGAGGFTSLEGGVVPLGATVDATDGKVRIATALPGGKTQTATFWGGAFTLTQSDADGLVDISLPAITRAEACAGPMATAAANRKRKAKPASKSLWVEDRDGKFRSRGRNSVASVRGTVWVTRERCEGTFTYVREGRVDVRDRKTGRVAAVTAGHGYLARD